MKQRAAIGRIDFQFFPRMTRSAQADQVVEGVTLTVPIWDAVMNLHAILALAQHTLVAVARSCFTSPRLPFSDIRSRFAAAPQYGKGATRGARLDFAPAGSAAARLRWATGGSGYSRSADGAWPFVTPTSAPSASAVALLRTRSCCNHATARHVKGPAANRARLYFAVPRTPGRNAAKPKVPRLPWPATGTLRRAVDSAFVPTVRASASFACPRGWPHGLRYHDYMAIAEARIVGDAPLFRRDKP